MSNPKKIPESSTVSAQKINQEIDGLETLLEDIFSEKEALQQVASEKFERLELLQKQEHSNQFFKPENTVQMNLELQKLHQNFISTLNDYPEPIASDLIELSSLNHFKQAYIEHHGNVLQSAELFFNAFEAYLQIRETSSSDDQPSQKCQAACSYDRFQFP